MVVLELQLQEVMEVVEEESRVRSGFRGGVFCIVNQLLLLPRWLSGGLSSSYARARAFVCFFVCKYILFIVVNCILISLLDLHWWANLVSKSRGRNEEEEAVTLLALRIQAKERQTGRVLTPRPPCDSRPFAPTHHLTIK